MALGYTYGGRWCVSLIKREREREREIERKLY